MIGRNRKFVTIVISLLLTFFMLCGSMSVYAAEEETKESKETTAANAGVSISSAKLYGNNYKFYTESKISSKKAAYSLSASVPRWMTGCTLYIAADKKTEISYEGESFTYDKSEYDGKSYFFYEFKFDSVKKDKKRSFVIDIKSGDAKSTFTLNITQTSRPIKFKFIKVNDKQIDKSDDGNYTVNLPSGTQKAKIKVRFVDEEKMTFGREGEDPEEGEISKAYQYYTFQPDDLDEGANEFEIIGYGGEKSVTAKLIINVGEVESSDVSSEEDDPSEPQQPDEGGSIASGAVLVNGDVRQTFARNEADTAYEASVILTKGVNKYVIEYNSDSADVAVLNLDAIENSDIKIDASVNGNNSFSEIDFTLDDSGYSANIPVEQGLNKIELTISSSSENPMKISLGDSEEAPVVPSAAPSSLPDESNDKSPFSGALLWIIIAVVVVIIIAACIIMMSGMNGSRRRVRDDDYDDYYREQPAYRRRDIGNYIDDGYNDGYDDGYYDGPDNGDYYEDSYDEGGYYDDSRSYNEPEDMNYRRRQGRRPNDYYDDRYDD